MHRSEILQEEKPAPIAPVASVQLPATDLTHPPGLETEGQTQHLTQDQSDDEIYDPGIRATMERLVAAKAEEGISLATRTQYIATADLFIRATGVVDVHKIRQHHVSKYRDILRKLPKSFGKSAQDATRSIDAAILEGTKLPRDRVGMSVGTINRHLDYITALLRHADGEGIEIDPKVQPSKLRLKDSERARDKRSSFKLAELQLLFSEGAIWKGSASRAQRSRHGRQIIKDGIYWAPLIAAYTGARREEICGMALADITEQDGIACFEIATNANRDLKTPASRRTIPIHSRLIELGLLDYATVLRRRKAVDLFPDLRPKNYVKGGIKSYGDRLDHSWRKTLELCFDGNPRKLCFHSLRHYVQQQLDLNPALVRKVSYDLMGHDGKDIHEKVYGEASPIADLKAAIETLPVVF